MRGLSDTSVAGVLLAGVHDGADEALERWLPRPLLPVAESPLLCYALRWLRNAAVRRVTICANGESRLVRHLLGDGSAIGVGLCYFEDRTPRGPAGCIRDAGLAVEAEQTVVVEGSVVPAVNLEQLLRAHRQRGAALTIVVGGPQRDTPAGIYVVARRALAHVPPAGYQDLKEGLVPALHRAGERVVVFRAAAPSLCVRDADTYLAANAAVLERLAREPHPLRGYRLQDAAVVHETARVAADARLVGPVMLGPQVAVGPGAIVVGPTVIGAGSTLGEQTLVSRSVLWDGCLVGRGCTLDGTILCSGGRVRPGTRLVRTVCAGSGTCPPARPPVAQPRLVVEPDPPAPAEVHDPDWDPAPAEKETACRKS